MIFTFNILFLLIFSASSDLLAQGFDINKLRLSSIDSGEVMTLQNRFFFKKHRPEIGISTGSLINEAYTNSRLVRVFSSLYLTEWFGLEVKIAKLRSSDSDDRKLLKNIKYRSLDSDEMVSPDPVVNLIKKIDELGVIVSPFYGKMNIFDELIIYSDIYLGSSLAVLDTSQGLLNGLGLSFGQKFYLDQRASANLEFRNIMFNEDRVSGKAQRRVYSIDIGISYFLM